ncbi:MAG: hypothetical protein NTW59_01720 [Candidatus Diapherotrites archaeon]|nr:hypothetical protein [Candidatus Diapherotrites archaeon]
MFRGTKAQTTTELIVIVLVVLLLFLIVTTAVMQKNFLTALMSTVSENTIQCGGIAATISNFRANPGYSEAKITLSSFMRVEKNNIRVGPCQNCTDCMCNTCNYLQSVRFKQSDTGQATDFISDSAGFPLLQGKSYKIKKTEEGVFFCEVKTENPWC